MSVIFIYYQVSVCGWLNGVFINWLNMLRIGEIYILKTGCSDSNDFLSILWDIHFCKC
jgi:hypothetical protein